LRLSTPAKILAIALAAYIVFDILLTPPAGLETVELIQTAVALIVIGAGIWTLRRVSATTS
jgi:cytochrome c-type biogenesis protein CcmH/NrfF